MPSSRRSGNQEKELSLFQIDAGKEWRGGQRQSFFLAKELKRQGYSFKYVIQPGSPLHQKAKEAGLPVFPLKISGEADVWSILRLYLAMKRRKCRLVNFHDAHSTAVGSAAASMAKVPLRVISRRVDFPLKKNVLSRRKYTKDVDAIIAVSERVKEVLVEGGIDRKIIRVIPDGIDFAPYEDKTSKDYLRKELSFAPDDFLVGIVAQLSSDKGHKYLIQSSKELREHSPKIKMVSSSLSRLCRREFLVAPSCKYLRTIGEELSQGGNIERTKTDPFLPVSLKSPRSFRYVSGSPSD